MEFLFKVHFWLVLFMHSVVLLKTMGSRGSQRMQGQNLKESKWNSICSEICLNSTVLLSKLNSLVSYSCLPNREGRESGQCSTGGNHHSSNVFKWWQFSPVKDLSQEVQVVSVRDLVHVSTMRFCLELVPSTSSGRLFQELVNMFLNVCWGAIYFYFIFFL